MIMWTAVYKKTKDGYVAWIEEIPGVNTQGKTKKATAANLRDALREFTAAQRILTNREYPKGSFVREPFPVRENVRT
ncbi:MAG: type II toxin-antitoxin system HicB family antitoxin [bacterium]|nr:type II toxin-antitoxin system HicB family antitoxin [bacterium]